MDLESLRCFVFVADTLSFRAASHKVSLSPGAFSERIRRLEEELGAPLLHRTTRRARLTEAGDRLLPHARELLAQASRCREVVHEDHRPSPYALTLGTRHELGLSWLCPALQPLSEAHPERTLHLFMGDTPDLMARTLRGDIDAVLFSARLTSPKLQYATIHAETYAFVGREPSVDGPGSARGRTLLDISPDLPLFRYLFDALPDGSPWTFARHEYLGGIGPVRFRALEGAGVAVLPEHFVRDDIAAGRLQRLMPEVALLSDAFRLVWRTGHPLDRQLLGLAEELRARPPR